MTQWEQAINNDFIKDLIKKVKELYQEHEDSKEYHQDIGQYIVEQLYIVMGEDYDL